MKNFNTQGWIIYINVRWENINNVVLSSTESGCVFYVILVHK
jgi:hypothetical protein